MSTKAYRVIQILTVKTESFTIEPTEYNAPDTLTGFMDEQGHLDTTDNWDKGLIKVPVEDLKKALEEVTLSEETRGSLEKDIEIARCRGEDFIQYYCY